MSSLPCSSPYCNGGVCNLTITACFDWLFHDYSSSGDLFAASSLLRTFSMCVGAHMDNFRKH